MVRLFSALSAEARRFIVEFVQALNGAAGAYAAAEAANASPLLSPWKTLTGRPLYGNGTNGARGTGQAGGGGGWLFGTAVMADRVRPGNPAVPAVAPSCSARAVPVVPAGSGTTGTHGLGNQPPA